MRTSTQIDSTTKHFPNRTASGIGYERCLHLEAVNSVEICCYLLKGLSGYHIVIMELFNKIKYHFLWWRVLWVDTFPFCLQMALPLNLIESSISRLKFRQLTHKLYMKPKCISYLQKIKEILLTLEVSLLLYNL